MTGYHTRWVRLPEQADDPERIAIREALAFGKAVYDQRCALGLTIAELRRRAPSRAARPLSVLRLVTMARQRAVPGSSGLTCPALAALSKTTSTRLPLSRLRYIAASSSRSRGACDEPAPSARTNPASTTAEASGGRSGSNPRRLTKSWPSRNVADRDAQAEAFWQQRALNAEQGLKAAHAEIRTQRARIGALLGQLRDSQREHDDDALQRLTTENTVLNQRLRLLTGDQRATEEKLQAARSNNRFLDKRIASLEAQLLDVGTSGRS